MLKNSCVIYGLLKTKQVVTIRSILVAVFIFLLALPANADRYSYLRGYRDIQTGCGCPNSDRTNRYGLYHGLPERMPGVRLGAISLDHVVALKISVNYFSGDIEKPGNLMSGFSDITPYRAESNNSILNNISGNLSLMYCFHPNPYIGIRAQLTGACLRGYSDYFRETKKGSGLFLREFEREFNSWMIEYTVGAEIYPFKRTGIYLYAGIGGATSHIRRNYNAYLAPTNPLLNLHDEVNNTVPVLPIGFGFKEQINRIILGTELIWHFALIDAPGMNMDGYPSGYSVDGKSYYPVDRKSNDWLDCFVELSFIIGGIL